MPARVRCPTCKREIAWSDEFPHRPFCSDRCRLIDLGAWLSEQHAIPDADAGLTDQTAHGEAPGED
jgi:endogenous inhibitor of DNA gyrase (YacG/DUF329 family)